METCLTFKDTGLIDKNMINNCIFNLDYVQINDFISVLKKQLKSKLNYK